MPIKGFQPSFAGGVLGPGLHGRVDLAKYDIGLKQGKNIFIHTHGGFSNRAGFEYICDVDDATYRHRLIPFERDDETNYVLDYGENTMRVINGGALVESGGSPVSVVSPYSASQVQEMDYEQSIDVMYIASRDVAPNKLEHVSATSWSHSTMTFNPTAASPTGVTVVSKNTGSETYEYVVTSVDDAGQESFASTAGSDATSELLNKDGAENVVTWTAAAGADHYRIFRKRGGVYGYVGFSESLSFTDDNISPDITITPPVNCTLFQSSGDYPSKVTLTHQRLIFGGTDNDPEDVWGSRAGDYENFTRSKVVKADDRFEAGLSGRSINSVRGLVGLRDLIAFGAHGEFSLSDEGVISATSPSVVPYGQTGSNGVKPLLVNESALFVERGGNVVRDLKYAFEQNGYSGNELSILAYQFFEGKSVVDWAFAQRPFNLIWVVMDDGSLLSMTYKREHQVWAWTEHDLDGVVESVASITESGKDAVYIIVKKTINSVERRMILRLHDRDFTSIEDAFFVDYGITYDGTAATTITGLSHLEGETVVALADGNVIEGLTVSSGQVTLAKAASKVHVGVSYQGIGETLPPAIDLKGAGTSRGRDINVPKVGVQVEKTRGIKLGQSEDDLQEHIQVEGPDLASSIDDFTGYLEVNVTPGWVADGGTVVMVQDYPLPMTVLAVVPEIAIGY